MNYALRNDDEDAMIGFPFYFSLYVSFINDRFDVIDNAGCQTLLNFHTKRTLLCKWLLINLIDIYIQKRNTWLRYHFTSKLSSILAFHED